MIRSFRHRGLERFFRRSDHRGIPAQFAPRLARVLDRLDAATKPEDMNVPGYRFHRLKGQRRGTYATDVSGNWRLTFRFDGEDAVNVDLEDCH
jgi:proteic killer suppression protein